jgi:hypothetical protein
MLASQLLLQEEEMANMDVLLLKSKKPLKL